MLASGINEEQIRIFDAVAERRARVFVWSKCVAHILTSQDRTARVGR